MSLSVAVTALNFSTFVSMPEKWKKEWIKFEMNFDHVGNLNNFVELKMKNEFFRDTWQFFVNWHDVKRSKVYKIFEVKKFYQNFVIIILKQNFEQLKIN